MTDRECARRARRGEVEAFGELVQRYQSSVFNVCYRLMGERRDAEDMAQEAFVRAYQRLETFDLDRPFGPWMRRVAANICLNRLSRRELLRVPLDEDHDRLDAAAETPAEGGKDRVGDLRQALAALPAGYRLVIELRHFQDMTYEEIAAATRTPVGQVRTHLFRARRLLARKLGRDVDA